MRDIQGDHNRAVRQTLSLALFAMLLECGTAHALPDELEVYEGDTTEAGRFAVDAASNYTVSGARTPPAGLRSSRHSLQFNPDFSYGLTKSSQVDLQVFSSTGLDRATKLDGARLEYMTVPIRPADDGDGLILGGLFEIGRLPRTISQNNLDGEVFLILGYQAGRWTFAANPEIDFKVSGNGSSHPGLATKFKASYRTDHGYRVGIEHYGDLGQLHQIGPLSKQSQQTFAVMDFKAKEASVNLGIGRGWTDVAERWVIKAVVSVPFGN